MAYDAAHNLLVVKFLTTNGGFEDEAQFGLRIGAGAGGGGVASQAQETAMLDDIENDLEAWWNAIDGYFPVTTRLSGFKFNAIGTDGLYVGNTTAERTWNGGSGIPGGAPPEVNALPSQVAAAVTLRTNVERGLASKGRIYLPPMHYGCLAYSGLMSEACRDALQGETATLITNLNNWPGVDAGADPGHVRVYSKVGNGISRSVTRIDVGLRFDTQRRRANKVAEFRQDSTTVQV
jgi:hypothetical protein